MAIQSFDDDDVRAVFESGRVGARVGWRQIRSIVLRKLDMLDYAADLRDLRSPPGNRLEALKGDRSGLNSVRINEQVRIIFRWSDGNAKDVRITDYH